MPHNTVFFCVCIFRMALQKNVGMAVQPYQKRPSITIKVVALKESTKVQRWEFSNGGARALSSHTNVVAAISDNTVVKFILFKNLPSQVQVGNCYAIKNYGVGKYGAQKSMLSRDNTAIYYCAPTEVPSRLEEEGRLLLAPPSTSILLKELNEGMESLMSVEGSVAFVSLYGGQPVQTHCNCPKHLN